MQKKLVYGLGGLIVLVVALVYWPIVHGDFVWDDWAGLHDNPWLTQGDLWKHYIFRDFTYWVYYFRPLGVALFTVQVRLFEGAPGPMHAVSLALLLIDTVLVGVLAWRCGMLSGLNNRQRTWSSLGGMMVFGLHPALIEPVSWIGAQFDLIVTMWTLLGVIANTSIQRPWLRAIVLASLLFLAGCTKESSISFPLLLILFDWMLFSGPKTQNVFTSLWIMIRRNGMAYLAMFVSGLIYLAFRHWALGSPVGMFSDGGLSIFGRAYMSSLTYLRYWEVILWPVPGMNPLHPFATAAFERVSIQSVLIIATTAIIVGTSIYTAIRRKSVTACIVLAVTASLFPVLHILTVAFERSYYHERYAMIAIAVMCSMLPTLRWPIVERFSLLGRTAKPAMLLAGLAWFTIAIIAIRTVTPLWASDENLWRWALSAYPWSPQAKDNLLHTYLKEKKFEEFYKLSDSVIADPTPCAGCALLIAKTAIEHKNTTLATAALKKAGESRLIVLDQTLYRDYYFLTGLNLIEKGELEDAEQVLRAALSIDPKSTKVKESLNQVIAMRSMASKSQ